MPDHAVARTLLVASMVTAASQMRRLERALGRLLPRDEADV